MIFFENVYRQYFYLTFIVNVFKAKRFIILQRKLVHNVFFKLLIEILSKVNMKVNLLMKRKWSLNLKQTTKLKSYKLSLYHLLQNKVNISPSHQQGSFHKCFEIFSFWSFSIWLIINLLLINFNWKTANQFFLIKTVTNKNYT